MTSHTVDPLFAGVRARFPITATRAYLFAGGMAPLCTQAQEAIAAHADLWARDPVAAYREDPRAEAALLRERIAGFLSARAEDVAIIDSTSRGNNLVAQMMPEPHGGNVVVDATTYPSALYPWLLPAKAGIEVRRVASDGELPLVKDFERLVDKRTVAISISHVCRLTGFRHDLSSLAELAHGHGAYLLVDGAQSVGAVRLDVEAEGVDSMAFGAMKWLLGTPGIGFLYLRQELAERLVPPHAGHSGARVADGRIEFTRGVARHELTGFSSVGLAASRRAAELLAEIPVARVEEWIRELSGRLIDGLRARGIEVLTPRDASRRAGVVAFRSSRPEALRLHLRARGVDVWGWERDGRMRADPHVYNTAEDVDRLLEGIDAFG